MRFYRLEKDNYFKIWGAAIFRALAYALIATIAIMLMSGYKFMIVSSGSMEPTLPVGSLVIVSPCEYEDLKYNDIVTMDAGGINLTHRIVGKYGSDGSLLKPGDAGYEESQYWVTQGDASQTSDGPLTDNVVGIVHEGHAWSWLGTVVRYVRANYTLLIIMLMLVVAFVSVIEWLKGKMQINDIEVYETDDEE